MLTTPLKTSCDVWKQHTHKESICMHATSQPAPHRSHIQSHHRTKQKADPFLSRVSACPPGFRTQLHVTTRYLA